MPKVTFKRPEIAVKNLVLLILGLPEFACGSSAVHNFAFEPHRARTYMHHICHSAFMCFSDFNIRLISIIRVFAPGGGREAI